MEQQFMLPNLVSNTIVSLLLLASFKFSIGSAFPCSLILAAGLFILFEHPFNKTIFNNKWAY